MALSPGSRLGVFEIAGPIGRGGMGEVYRARDTNLDRDVAIKVLPQDFSQHKERLARFRHEAKLLAALNHPNVATVHDFQHEGDTDYLVMELVEGETLAERIENTPLSIEEALPLFIQIVSIGEGAGIHLLAAAHPRNSAPKVRSPHRKNRLIGHQHSRKLIRNVFFLA